MKILVTGATGFLGSHLCRRLIAEGHAVTILRRAASNISALDSLDIRQEVGEITDAVNVERATRGQDVVIHAAASLPARGDPIPVQHRINVEGTNNVVQGCIRNGVRRLLHVSSVAAIGIPDRPAQPANEDFPFNLERSQLHYHISKHRAECVVAAGVARGLDAVIVNPTGMYGLAGSYYRGSDIIQTVRQARVLRFPAGGVCVVHVQDVVDGLLAALERGVTGNRYILGGENLTFRELMEKAANAIGVKRWFVPIPAAAARLAAGVAESFGPLLGQRLSTLCADHHYASRFSFYDSSKARVTLGFRARTFDAILKDCVSSLKQLPA